MDGSVKDAFSAPGQVRFFRIAVSSICVEAVTETKGELTEIKKDSKLIWSGDKALLTFARAEHDDAHAKTIHDNLTEYLDVLAVQDGGMLVIATKDRTWPFSPSLIDIFNAKGEYGLTVKISAKNTPTVTANLKFNWTRDRQTSELILINS